MKGDISNINNNIKLISETKYNELSTSKKNNGTIYLVKSDDGTITIKKKDIDYIATNANRAKEDASGNVITDTYAKKSIYDDTAVSMGRKAGTTIGTNSFVYGLDVEASGNYSHAEGVNTTAIGWASHAEGYECTALGEKSHAEGHMCTAFGWYSHAEGGSTNKATNYVNSNSTDDEIIAAWKTLLDGGANPFLLAKGINSHAEGWNCLALGVRSHTEGDLNIAIGDTSHAEGSETTASGYNSHTEGHSTTASGSYAHAEGLSTNKATEYVNSDSTDDEIITAWNTNKFSLAKGEASHVEGWDCLALGPRSHAEGTLNIAIGNESHVEGLGTKTQGHYSHAEGYNTTASGESSHAEGNSTTASSYYSHAEGVSTTASGLYSHAEGCNTTASRESSHAEGYNTTASGDYSHAEGRYTVALRNQHVQGHYNNTTNATENSIEGISSGTAFVIGNGTESSRSNAFRISGDGYIYATNASVQAGADYAEYFEWADGNPNEEDRVGYFVTFEEDNPEKIRIANENDYILGIVSGMPSVIGNGDECWKQRYVLDDFGRYIEETFEYELVVGFDDDGNEIKETKIGTKWKENPEYDQTKPYTPRAERAEWNAIGMVGVLSVYDDGTCQVNGYCKSTDGGIATACEKEIGAYRVIKRVTDNIVKVVLK